MRANRRRSRVANPLYTPDAVRSVLIQLRDRSLGRIPKSERQLVLMLEAVRHIERHPATDTKRGRPSRWKREDLLEVARHLRAILERETSGRISLQSFIGQYLPVLRFPSDIQLALANGDINLPEASHLARLTPERLNCLRSEARALRAETLRNHLAMHGSQNRLRDHVKDLLGEGRASEVNTQSMTAVLQRVDELLEIDPSDARHMFWEELKRLFYSMREIQPEDLDEQILEEFMGAMDEVSNIINRIELRQRKRKQQSQKMKI